MSPDHVTSLWPTIIAEMVQVFLAIEQELKADSEEFRYGDYCCVLKRFVSLLLFGIQRKKCFVFIVFCAVLYVLVKDAIQVRSVYFCI